MKNVANTSTKTSNNFRTLSLKTSLKNHEHIYIYIYTHTSHILKNNNNKNITQHLINHRRTAVTMQDQPHAVLGSPDSGAKSSCFRSPCVGRTGTLMCYMMLHVYVVCLQCIHGIHELFSMYAMYHIYQIVMDDLGAWVRLFGGIATAVSADIFWQKR